MLTLIRGSRLIDPATGTGVPKRGGVPGQATADLWLQDGKIVAEDTARAAAKVDREIDGSGCVTMAGGIDMHTHIGGGKVSLARMLLGDQMPPWRVAKARVAKAWGAKAWGDADDGDPAQCEFLPAAGVAASRYLDMGYTTCFEPAVIPCNARSAHAEMADVHGLDTGGYCLLGNDDVLLQLISENADQAIINSYVAWMVTATRCIAVKVVNPGGINAFKFNQRQFDVDTVHPHYQVTPGRIVRTLCRAVHEIGLAHPLHVHCSNLGVPGNIDSTLSTIRAADGYPIHLTHAQFHCYGADGPYNFSSAASKLVEAMQKHPNVTIDVGQIQFGRTVTLSADSMHQFENRLHAKPRKSVLLDIECEAGCGVVPFRYARREFVHCLQWAIGLELLLMIDNPSRVFLTTDHPNGGPFTAYPHLLRLLSDRSFRHTALSEIHPEAAAASSLGGIDREYTMEEIAIMTRSAPANILGLRDRGNLCPGSMGDVVVYREQPNREEMFRTPEYVFKAGELIREKGKAIKSNRTQKMDSSLVANPDFDSDLVSDFRTRYNTKGIQDLSRLWIDKDEMSEVLGSLPVDLGMRT